MGATPSVSLWTAATWTAPETQTRVLPSPPQPANLPSLCPIQRTGRICSVIHVSHILYKWFNLMHTLFFLFVMAMRLILCFCFFLFFCSISPPKQLFVESPAPSAAPAAQDQGMSIPVIGSSEYFCTKTININE